MIELLRREAVYLWYYFSVQLEQIFKYWVSGMVLGSLVSVFLKEPVHRAFRSMGEKRLGIVGIVIASALGIASPLCMYGTIPIAASFSQSGITADGSCTADRGCRDDWLAAFMMSSILLNPQLIIYSAALGVPALTVRILSCFLCGIFAGGLIRIFYNHQPFFNFHGFEEPVSRDTDPNLLFRFLKNLGRNVKATGWYFLAGIALSALFQRYVPTDVMTGVFGGNEAFGILMAATIGVPLYACGGGTIPLLQAWLMDGMSLGSAAAFMITGPATKITNLGAVKIVLGMKRFALYLAYVMKPFSGGQLLEDKTSPFGRALTRYQCIQYSLDKPGVLTVLPGIRNVEDVKNLLGFLTASSRERDYSVVGTFTPGEAVGNCVYCNHCQPCPAGLNVGLINKYYNLDGFLEQGGASDDLAVAAPFAPMDGMNEKGLCVAVLMIQDSPGFRQDTGKPDLTTTMAVRSLPAE